jgi:AcrR family transcriptional regulator
MAAPTLTPRDRWIDEGLNALADGGPDAVRIEPLARALGVTKGGFYGQFGDRGALLEEMLDTWERTMVDEVIERVDQEGDDARARLHRLFTIATSGPGLLKAELAIRDWARRDRAVARRVKRVDNRRMDYMRSLFGAISSDEEEAEARCLIAFSIFIGSPFISADHPGRSRMDVVERALALLESPGDGDLHR